MGMDNTGAGMNLLISLHYPPRELVYVFTDVGAVGLPLECVASRLALSLIHPCRRIPDAVHSSDVRRGSHCNAGRA
jgi:hypothetical protein